MQRRILVVDDEPEVVQFLTKRLTEAGFKTDSASNGDDCLAKLRREQPDLVLLDIMMPGKDGFAVLKEIREDPQISGTVVIMVTAKSESGSLFQGQALGATDYLIKPVDFQELLKFIDRYTKP